MLPLAHPLCCEDSYSESGLEYCILRLPKEIIFADEVLLTADISIVRETEKNDNYKKVFCKKRRRTYYFNEKDAKLIIGINSETDLHDILSVLSGLVLEAIKLKKLNTDLTKDESLNRFSEKHLRELTLHFGRSNFQHFIKTLSEKKEIKEFIIRI